MYMYTSLTSTLVYYYWISKDNNKAVLVITQAKSRSIDLIEPDPSIRKIVLEGREPAAHSLDATRAHAQIPESTRSSNHEEAGL